MRRELLLLLLLTLFVCSAHAETGHRVGQTAPVFTLKSLDGPEIFLDKLLKKGHVLLIFWETQCVYCFSHIQEFNSLHDQYNNNGMTVTAINIAGEHVDEIREFKKENGLKYLLLADRVRNIDVAETYHVFGSPTLFLISPGGIILFKGHKLPDIAKWVKTP